MGEVYWEFPLAKTQEHENCKKNRAQRPGVLGGISRVCLTLR